MNKMKLLREVSTNAKCHNDASIGLHMCEQMDFKYDDVLLGSLENTILHMASLLQSDKCRAKVLTNQTVTSIVSNELETYIVTDRGDTFFASYVISTVPAGVLQHSPSIFHEPSLPLPFKSALENLEIIKSSIVHLSLNHSIPNAIQEAYYTIPINAGSDKQGSVDLLNLNSFMGEDILVLQANHNASIILESLSESALVNVLVQGIQEYFSCKLHVKSSLISHWGLHPNIRGAYTTLSSCSKASDRATLRQPIGGRIVLAGEWVASTDPGTIHGAYQSGIEQATLLLQDGFAVEEQCLCDP